MRKFGIKAAYVVFLLGSMVLVSGAWGQDRPTLRAYPNPVHAGGRVRIDYSVPQAGKVEIEVFDLMGRRLLTLLNTRLEPGRDRLDWPAANRFGRPLAPGTYRISLRTLTGHAEQKVVIIP